MVPSWLPLVAPLVVLAGVGVHLTVRARRSADARVVARGWPQTPGTVLSTSIQVRRVGTSRSETPVVVYAYQVNGQPFQSYRVRVGDENGRVRVAGDAARTIARYPVGSTVTVFYDPADPAIAALER